MTILTHETLRTTGSVTDCPPWCALPADHASRVEPDVDGTRYVDHHGPVLAEAGGRPVDLHQATAISPDGSVEAQPVRIVVDGGDPDHGLEVRDARHLAAALALAAELAAGSLR